MDHKHAELIRHIISTALLAVTVICFIPSDSSGQSQSYEILPAPDLWFNSVDGIRVGGRFVGQMEGTFGDGPHRLKAGVWLGTKFPDNPVSYYLSFTEPIPSISEFGSEANINVESSFRTGFQQHGLTFNKRWQTGFDEKNYKELAVGFRFEHRFDDDYLLYRQLWQDSWLYMPSVNLLMTDEGAIGRYRFSFSVDGNIGSDQFLRSEIAYQQQAVLSDNFTFSGRIYSGFATDQTAPEYLFSHSFRSPRNWMDSGLTRARGTIPPSWMNSGNIQITGGANLRGYVYQDIQQFNNLITPLYTSLSSVNFELDYPNPLEKAFRKIPVIGDFVNLRSYLFFDAGTSLGLTSFEDDRVLADAGPGFLFSINIPDYLGKPRGIVIRYDLPLWISHPGAENPFKFRNVIGMGAVIPL